ncbi:GNAT family N-acetyltransferase [Aquamicrobium defluvii]|uniref:Acetyltransferase n=1 Tax=Aquamicrobium defluvii TaxID=69279 RepID=A0A011TC38_9HYPH|nr:N-acetyltransferase [Aquamicrobium defluvii]EXL01407.1 acetyltransferase [Aquamicrobium defluvii]EZQ12664.1 acetyltransferase [Halopseudomonas bauzanensis]TDR30852.1 ribosomal protein S18 acetylase RimI-like enzyme [Aquamicrobium defluvii]
MSHAVSIRPAQKGDAAEMAILVDISSHGFASWFWYGAVLNGSKETAFEEGRCFMRSDTQPAAWKDASIALVGDEIAGVIIGHPILPSIMDETAPHPVVEPILELQKTIAGDWFIDSLGVYRHHRGRGLGKRLLAHEIARAGNRPVSLITESDNETALGLYKSHGFAEVTRRQAVPLTENGKQHDWVLLTRSAA